jgi:hypothetical protein
MERATRVPPLPIARGDGPWLEDFEGRRYFDATSSWWVNLFGHGDARLKDALRDQLDRLPHVLLAGCTHAPAVELAERLRELTGGTLGHCFYASDGASAVEIALKMSFHYWRNIGHADKREFVCLRQGYHGETLGALAVTDVAVFRDAYDPLLMRAHQVIIDWLLQSGRSYIYTTATPAAIAHALRTSLALIGGDEGGRRRVQLRGRITQLRDGVADIIAQRPSLGWRLAESTTAIQPLIVGDNERALALSSALDAQGLWVPAIRPPTVPAGTARLRITLSASHSVDDVERLLATLARAA